MWLFLLFLLYTHTHTAQCTLSVLRGGEGDTGVIALVGEATGFYLVSEAGAAHCVQSLEVARLSYVPLGPAIAQILSFSTPLTLRSRLISFQKSLISVLVSKSWTSGITI